MIESINDALIACVKALGGSKQVGPRLWPEKAPDAAQRHLLDCLNEDRPAKLSPEQVMLIFRWARDIGFHAGFHFVCSGLGYSEAQPIDQRDELTELLRQQNELRAELIRRSDRIERLLSPQLRGVA